MGREQTERRKRLLFYIAFSLLIFWVFNGCLSARDHFTKTRVYEHLEQAKKLVERGYFWQAISEQEKALKLSPDRPPGDQVLYEMGLLLIDPRNHDRDYVKSLETFRLLSRVFPGSDYRNEAESWASVLSTVLELHDRQKKNESEIKRLHDELLRNEQTIQSLREQREKMKEIDLELNKKRESTPSGRE